MVILCEKNSDFLTTLIENCDDTTLFYFVEEKTI